jgi:hypothetical protein
LIYTTLSNGAYEEYFPGITSKDTQVKEQLRETFTYSFVSVVTRCFGWGLPKTSMIPFADCINHHNVDSTYELIHTRYHQYIDAEKDHPMRGPAAYYTISKIEGDYSDFLNYEEYDSNEESDKESHSS